MDVALEYVGVAIVMALFDVIYTQYLLYVERREPLKAALASVLMYLFNSWIILKWVEDPLFIVSAVIGGFFGTYFVVRINQ